MTRFLNQWRQSISAWLMISLLSIDWLFLPLPRTAAQPSQPEKGTAPALPRGHGAGSASAGMPDEQPASIQALTTAGKNMVYAGSFGMGVFKSDDRGGLWISANEGLTDPFILSLATGNDGALYAGTFRGGVFRSRDEGRTWQAINEGLKRLEIKTLLVTPAGIYAGTGDGVYLLNQPGTKWAVVTNGLDEILVHAIAKAKDGTLYAGTSGKGVVRFKEEGSGWTRLRQGLRDHEGLVENFIRVLTIDKDNGIYAGTFDGGVFRSADGGQTWSPISRALPNDSIRGLVSNDRGIYVATGRGIYKTVDHGRQWTPLNQGLSNLSIQALLDAGQGAWYAGTSAGVFRSDNDGASWTAVSEGLQGGVKTPFRF
jgi:ligand-binding sensor domain-containing protein